MLGALIAGERDPAVLADLAKGKMRAKIPALTEALTGHFDAGHAQLDRSILHRLELVETPSPSWMRSSPRRAGRGRISWTCCRPFPASGRRWPR